MFNKTVTKNYKVELLLEGLGIQFPTQHQRLLTERALLNLPLYQPFVSESVEGILKANSVASRIIWYHRLVKRKQVL